MAGNREGDAEVAEEIDRCMSLFSDADITALEEMVRANFEDVLKLGSLTKLMRVNLRMTDKMNQVFAAQSKLIV